MATAIGLADSGNTLAHAGRGSATTRPESEPPGEGAIVTDPLVPSAYDVVWAMVMLAPLVLAVGALVSLGRSRAGLTATQTLVWVLLILLVPLLGAVAWLAAGRPRTPLASPQ